MSNPADLDRRLRSAAGGEPDTERALADVMGRIGRRTRRRTLVVVAALAVAVGALAVWAVDARRSDDIRVAADSTLGTESVPSPEDEVALLRDAPLAVDYRRVNPSALAGLADAAEPHVATESIRYVATRGNFSYFVGTNTSDDRVCLLILHTDRSGATGCATVAGLLSRGLYLTLVAQEERGTAVLVPDAFASAPAILALGEAHGNLVIVDDPSQGIAVSVSRTDGPPLDLEIRAPDPVPQGHSNNLDDRSGVSARVVLPSQTMTAGSSMDGRVIVENNSGRALHVTSCGSIFQVALGNDSVQPQLDCLPRAGVHTIPIGESTYPVTIRASYYGCSYSPQSHNRPCLPNNGGPPPLPPGDYQAILYQYDNVIPDPPSITVHVTP